MTNQRNETPEPLAQGQAGETKWKCGNEFAPYHPSASHCDPKYRDGWNHCYHMAAAALQAKDAEIARLKADAGRYRWLRERDWFNSDLCVLREPKRVLTRGIGLGADCPSRNRLDDAIDAAIRAQTGGEG